MTPRVAITTQKSAWRRVRKLATTTRKVVAACVDAAAARLPGECEVSVLLCDDERIRELNAAWRRMDKPTNVLSFPAATGGGLLGDIIVAYETVDREAREEGKPFTDHYAHMIAHGFLHLLGYDHETERDAGIMEAIEIAALASLAIANPYADIERKHDA